MAERPVLLAAGGTGGHVFPAEALAFELIRRGIPVALATDRRAARFTALPAEQIHMIRSETLRGRDVMAWLRLASGLALGTLQASRLIGRIKPRIVVGFGGYPTVPPVMAAVLRGLPTMIHEQNGVLGRANALLAPRVTAIATGFRGALDDKPRLAAKAVLIGNPVRPAVVEAARIPYDWPTLTTPLRLLVFGGSQGAQIMSDVVPGAIENLDAELRSRLMITHQAREEDGARVRLVYAKLQLRAEVEPFFHDLPARIATAHLVVSRSGASTVAELMAIGRPGILVPLPHALDQDQLANAHAMVRGGGAILLKQNDFTPFRLAEEISRLARDPARLQTMAASARQAGSLNAAERLANLVVEIAGVAAVE